MNCPYCHIFVEKDRRTCPSCGYQFQPERRIRDRHRVFLSPPIGIERRKKHRRRREEVGSWE